MFIGAAWLEKVAHASALWDYGLFSKEIKRNKTLKMLRVRGKEQGFSKINSCNCCFLCTSIPSTLMGDAGTVWSGVGGTMCKPSEVLHVFPSNWTSSILLLPTHSLTPTTTCAVSKNSTENPHTRLSRADSRGRAGQAWEIDTAHKSLEEFLSLSEGVIRLITEHKLWCINSKVYRDSVCI